MSTPPAIRWQTLCPRRAAPPSAGPEAALARAVAFVREAARAGAPLLIVVNDPARATPTRWVLGAIAAELPAPQRPALALLVATGTHRFGDSERARFESGLLAGCGLDFTSLAWHDARAADDEFSTVALPAGRFRINRRILEHEWLLAIGSVEPHYFAGVTGAHKTCTIGVMSREDIERNHRGALDPASDVMALAGNPVHDGIVRAAAALDAAGKLIFAINQVVCGGALLGAAAGDVFGSLDELLPLVRATYIQTVDEPADVLHLRVPPPLGRSFYQADKALKNNHLAVRDGGAIVLDAECPEGVGPDAFMNLLRQAPDYDGAVRAVEARGYQLGDHKGVKLRYLTDAARRGVRVAIISRNISAADAHALGMRVFANADDALAWLKTAASGGLRRGLVIDDAGFVSVRAESAQR